MREIVINIVTYDRAEFTQNLCVRVTRGGKGGIYSKIIKLVTVILLYFPQMSTYYLELS